MLVFNSSIWWQLRKSLLQSAQWPVAVAAGSKAWVYGLSLAGIANSNPAGSMNVCVLSVLSVVRWRSLRRADHLSRGVLPSVVCLNVIEVPHGGGLDSLGAVEPWAQH